MKKILLATFSLIIFTLGFLGSFYLFKNLIKNKNTVIKPKDLPLLAYTFENLKNTNLPKSEITFGEVIDETKDYKTQKFYFQVPEKPNGKNFLKVSGLANIPKIEKPFPIIVMFRGYIPKETYKPGAGSQPSAKVLAKNGFLTLVPDFLGYGESDNSPTRLFEDRFQTYITALTLIKSLDKLTVIGADPTRVGIWGHSNGGQIALSTLAISGTAYPTVLWAPVSKPFPYSILFYTDETDDQGKALRKALSIFEKDYDVFDFSPTNYYSWIKAPIQIHQGTRDEEVLPFWTDELVEILKENKIEVSYYKYQEADHNFLPNGWNETVLREVSFFKKKLQSS